jgi:hypothetical protein
MKPHVVASSFAMEGLERDFKSPDWEVKSFGPCRFKSRAGFDPATLGL